MIVQPLIICVVVVCCGIILIAIAYLISKYCCNKGDQPPQPPSQPSTSRPGRPFHVHCSGYSRFYDSSETVRGSYSTRINLNPARVSGSTRANASSYGTTSNPSRLSVSDFVVDITPAARSTVDHNPARASRSSRVDHNSGRASHSARVDHNSPRVSSSTRDDHNSVEALRSSAVCNSALTSGSTRVDRNSAGTSGSARIDHHNSVGASGSTIPYATFRSITPTHYRFSASDFGVHNPPTVNQFLGATGTPGYSGSSGNSGVSTTSTSYQIPTNSRSTRLPTRNPPPARPSPSTSTGNRTTNSVSYTQADRRDRDTRRPNLANIRTTGSNINNNHNHNHSNRVQQQNSESSEQLQFRRTVLHHFKCPFEEEEACMYKNTPRRCFFTHVGPNGTEGATDLKEVPAYACIYHLVKPDTCRGVHKRTNNTAQNPNSLQNILPCINGIHLSVEQMIDLDHYERTNRQTIRRFFGQDAERQCAVCLETVLSKRLSRNRRFAILENCAHCFCAQCIIGWRNQSVQLTCPLCRTVSDRVAYRRRFTDKPAQKRNMFR